MNYRIQSLLAWGFVAASLPLVALAEDKSPTPPDFSVNFLNIPLTTAEPPTPQVTPATVDAMPLPDLTQKVIPSKERPSVSTAPVKTTPIASEPPAASPEVQSKASDPQATTPEATTPPPEAAPNPVVSTPTSEPTIPATSTGTPIETIVGTGFSSLLNQQGDTIKVFLNTATTLPNGQVLPAGTQLLGKIESIQRNKKHAPQDMKILFNQAIPPLSSPIAIQASPDTPDGMLTPGASAIILKENHSYESLKGKLVKSLGADQTVYNQRLNVNSSQTGDYRKDAFIQSFHKNAVLVGSGDQLRLRFMP